MNAVDVIYAASPVYLYLNPEILGYLLRPLLEYQETHLYPNSYAARDIGMSFPNIRRLDGLIEGLKGTNYSMAIGNNEVHSEGIERKQISRWSSFFNRRLSNQNAVYYRVREYAYNGLCARSEDRRHFLNLTTRKLSSSLSSILL